MVDDATCVDEETQSEGLVEIPSIVMDVEELPLESDDQCYRNRTGHRTSEAQNVNWTRTDKKPGKKLAY